MRSLFKLLLWLLAGALALGLGAAALAVWLVSRSAPDYDAAWSIEGLSAPVEIIRDAHAIPHVYAETRADALTALGYVHAQDRLWQMELSRRGAQGRLSEIFGAAALPVDRAMRTFGLYEIARRSLPLQDEATRTALEAYARGVNARIAEVNERALGRGAPEFFLFGEGLAPWTPTDSLAILKVMAVRLTGAAEREVRRAKLLGRLTPEKVRDLFPDYPDAGVIALPSYARAYPGLRFREAAARPARTAFETAWLPGPDHAGASNAWAVDGARTTSGAPLLASDPHLWLSAPSVWHLAHLETPEGAVIGGALPGVPAVVVGRNRAVAWGLTTTNMDDQDVFIEKLNPDDPGEYLTPTGWRAFETRRELIQVKGADPVEMNLRWTRHGPVLPPEVYDVGAVTPEGHVAALGWTALSAEDYSLAALLALNTARDLDEAVAAGGGVLAPAQNVVTADADGVAMYVAGRPPLRRAESRARGLIPALGWLAENDWRGLGPGEETPRAVRPPSGAVANGNNRVTSAPFPDHLSHSWAAPYRIRRIESRLNAREFHTRESFAELQTDTVSQMARSVLPLIAADLWWTLDQPADDTDGRRREAALRLLSEWNGEMSEHAPEPLIFAAWMRALTRRLSADELGELADLVEGPRPLFVERVFRNVDGAGAWCDVTPTPRPETCADMARAALDDALAELEDEFGGAPEGWRWGEAHVATHKHTPLGARFPFDLFVNIEQETSGGDYTVMRGQTPGKGPTPYANVHAAGFRAVYDFADLDRSIFVISSGQSGHPGSRHYDDLAVRWRGGDYVPMTMNRGEIEAGAVGRATLSPR